MEQLQLNFNETESKNNLEVVSMEFKEAKSLTWQDLFLEFDEMKAITFSTGVEFMKKLIDSYKKVEIIFGCESVMSNQVYEILAYQTVAIKKIGNCFLNVQNKISNKIDNGDLKLYIAKKIMSHEKLYLLSSRDGRKRVIFGSANMSYNAFNGVQRENIALLDGDDAYNYYLKIFEDLKIDSTNEISKNALFTKGGIENIDKIPLLESANLKPILIDNTVNKETEENIIFDHKINELKKELKNIVPIKKEKKYVLDFETLKKIKKNCVEKVDKEKIDREELPQLIVDCSTKKASLNGVELDLNPEEKDVEEDVKLFVEYLNGYKCFHGDALEMQSRYYEFANWYFCTPFMATLRYIAHRNKQQNLPYPVFGLLYGKSKAGKTSFLETLLKMMIGQNPKIAARDFTTTVVEGLKRTAKGAPVIVDDMVNRRFTEHAVEVIKNDDFGIKEPLLNYPAVVISANEDVKAVASEVVRRTVICKIDAGLTNTEIMNNNIVRKTQAKIKTAFYREYLKRMFIRVEDAVCLLEDENNDIAPDILKTSSEVLYDIISEYVSNPPEYIRVLNLNDYFGEKVTGKSTIKTITNAWNINKKLFKINKKMNQLIFDAGEQYEAKRIYKELPETLEAKIVHTKIVMKLDSAIDFFNIKFKNSIFSKKV